jgi:hypothetical protein
VISSPPGSSSKPASARRLRLSARRAVLTVHIIASSSALGTAMRHDGGAETRLILGAAWDVVALSVATGLSVLKPRRILARARRVGVAG